MMPSMNDPPNREVLVFNAALQLPPGERGDYLGEACRSNSELRDHVEALIEAHERAGAFLQEPADVPVGSSVAAARGQPNVGPSRPVSSLPGEKCGDHVGQYKLLQQIGEGGCGVVYMAEQAEPVRRRVALKVIKLGMDTKQVIARFEAERQALAMMDHPNIAKIFDAGITERPLTPSLSPSEGERVPKAGEGSAPLDTRHSSPVT